MKTQHSQKNKINFEKLKRNKGQNPKNRLSCIFQAIGNIIWQKVQSQHDQAQATEHKG